MTWTHHNPVFVIGGAGSVSALPSRLRDGNVLLVTSEGMMRRGTAEALMRSCPRAAWHTYFASPNPDLADLDEAIAAFADKGIQKIVALGGGSAMDSAKALAFGLLRPGERPLERWFYGGEAQVMERALPFICLPTTAGTGAEVTPFGTIWDMARGKKQSIAGPVLYAEAAILDPELTVTLPWGETLWGAMDTVSHAMETLWNKNATPVALLYAEAAIHLVAEHLPLVPEHPERVPSRDGLQRASLLAGLAISQNRTAIAHALSYPLTIHYGIPHGLACSFAIPGIVAALDERNGWRSSREKELGRGAAALVREYDLAGLVRGYCSSEQVLGLLDEMFAPGRADNFMFPVDREQLASMLEASLA